MVHLLARVVVLQFDDFAGQLRTLLFTPAEMTLADQAALAIERISYLAGGQPVEFTRSFYRGDTYDFVAELNLGQD